MAYTLDFGLGLGTAKAGLSDLRAQVVDTVGGNIGTAASIGFTEIGSGYYLWHSASIPDTHRGGVKFYSNAASTTFLAFSAINPEEAEYLDTKLAPTASAVWTVTQRTITGGSVIATSGSVVATNVTDKTGYTLAASAVTSGVFTDSAASAVWNNVPARGITANSDKVGYGLSASAVDDVLDEIIEGTVTSRQAQRLYLAALAGKSSGGGTTIITFQDNADLKPRISASVSAVGDRTAVTLDPT